MGKNVKHSSFVTPTNTYFNELFYYMGLEKKVKRNKNKRVSNVTPHGQTSFCYFLQPRKFAFEWISTRPVSKKTLK